MSFRLAIASVAVALCSSCASKPVKIIGTLDDNDARLSSDGSAYDRFVINVDAGEELHISVKAEGYEPALFLFNEANKQLFERRGTLTRVALKYRSESEERYTLLVNASSVEGRGPYTLDIKRGPQ